MELEAITSRCPNCKEDRKFRCDGVQRTSPKELVGEPLYTCMECGFTYLMTTLKIYVGVER